MNRIFKTIISFFPNNKENQEIKKNDDGIQNDLINCVDFKVNNSDVSITIKKTYKIGDFYTEIINNNKLNFDETLIGRIRPFITHWICDNCIGKVIDKKLFQQTISIIIFDNSVFSISTLPQNLDRLVLDERKKVDESTIEETQIDIQNGIEYTISRWVHTNGSSNFKFYKSGTKNISVMNEERAKNHLNEMLKTLEKTESGEKYVNIVQKLINSIEEKTNKNNRSDSVNEYTQIP